eukprot:2239568-Amphidinium_carterae.1
MVCSLLIVIPTALYNRPLGKTFNTLHELEVHDLWHQVGLLSCQSDLTSISYALQCLLRKMACACTGAGTSYIVWSMRTQFH